MSVAFVAGATGYTGREVVRALIERSVATVAHVRPDSRELERYTKHFTALGAATDHTPWELEAMTRTFERVGPTHVFALLGTTRARMKSARQAGRPESYGSVDLGLTALLIKATAASAARARFVYLSAAGVAETARSPYYRARWDAEHQLRRSGLSYIIARPSFIVGPDRDERRPLERLGAAISDRALTVAGWFGGTGLRDRYRSTSNTVLARALVRLALDPAAENTVVESEDLR